MTSVTHASARCNCASNAACDAGSLDAYSDYTVQWGAGNHLDEHPGKTRKQFWAHRNGATKPTRQTVQSTLTARQYQDKSPHPTRGGGLRGVEGEAQPPPPALVVPKAPVPKHVHQCLRQGGRGWALWVWNINHPETKTRLAYTCRSWRCVDADGKPTDCARAAAAQLFARIKEATDKYPSDEFTSWVLTLDREGFYTGGRKPWVDAEDAYRQLGHMSERFIKRLRRWCVKMGWTHFESKWIQVVEAHKSGWPHVNLLIHHPQLAQYVQDHYEEQLNLGHSETSSKLLFDDILNHATACDWGTRSTVERVRSKDAMAGYIAKLAAYADEHIGELAKLTQAPTNAPIKFRRVRSGKGFLPPCRKNPNWTGVLTRRYYHKEWGYIAEPFLGKKNPTPQERLDHVNECTGIEEKQFIDELVREQRAKQLPKRWQIGYYGLPPVSTWLGGKRVAEPKVVELEPFAIRPP